MIKEIPPHLEGVPLPKGVKWDKKWGWCVHRKEGEIIVSQEFKSLERALAFREELYARPKDRFMSNYPLSKVDVKFKCESFNEHFDNEMARVKGKYNPYARCNKQYCLDMVELLYENLDHLIDRLARFPAEKGPK